MRAALAIAAFVGWGGAGWFIGSSSPNVGFLVGMAVGAGVMLYTKGR